MYVYTQQLLNFLPTHRELLNTPLGFFVFNSPIVIVDLLLRQESV